MQVAVTSVLSPEQEGQWRAFLGEAKRIHPEQDPRFADAWRVCGNDILYAMGWVGDDLRAVAMFVASKHPIPGFHDDAIAMSGPVCDDADDLVQFLNGIERQRPFKSRVGLIRVAPYWLEPDETELQDALVAAGWQAFETWESRCTGLYDLSGTPDDIIAGFRKDARRHLRRSMDFGLTVEFVTDEATAMEAYRIYNQHNLSRGMDAVNEQAFRADFRNAYSTLDCGALFVVRLEGDIIAGCIVQRSWHTMIFRHLFADDAALPRLGKVRVTPHLTFEGLKWAQKMGCRWGDEDGYYEGASEDHELYGAYQYKAAFNPTQVRRIVGHQKRLNPMVEKSAHFLNERKDRVRAFLAPLRRR